MGAGNPDFNPSNLNIYIPRYRADLMNKYVPVGTIFFVFVFLSGEQTGQDYDKVVESGGEKRGNLFMNIFGGLGIGLEMIWRLLARFCPVNDFICGQHLFRNPKQLR